MTQNTTRDLLKTATGEQWAQVGSTYIVRCDAPGRPREIAQALSQFGIPADVNGLNSVQVTIREAQTLDAATAHAIRDYLTDGVEIKPAARAARAR